MKKYIIILFVVLTSCSKDFDLSVLGTLYDKYRDYYPELSKYYDNNLTRTYITGWYDKGDAHLIYEVIDTEGYGTNSDTVVIPKEVVVICVKRAKKAYELEKNNKSLLEVYKYALVEVLGYDYHSNEAKYNPYEDVIEVPFQGEILSIDINKLKNKITRIEYTGDINNKIDQLFETHPALVSYLFKINMYDENYKGKEGMDLIIWAMNNRNLIDNDVFKLYADLLLDLDAGRYMRAANKIRNKVNFVNSKDKIEMLINGNKVSYIPMDVFDY
jgi:hypothetical protein